MKVHSPPSNPAHSCTPFRKSLNPPLLHAPQLCSPPPSPAAANTVGTSPWTQNTSQDHQSVPFPRRFPSRLGVPPRARAQAWEPAQLATPSSREHSAPGIHWGARATVALGKAPSLLSHPSSGFIGPRAEGKAPRNAQCEAGEGADTPESMGKGWLSDDGSHGL